MAESEEKIDNTEEDTDEVVSQYLTFQLSGEQYGIDILRVQEIRGWETVTRIPNAPVYVKGVLNLRGSIVPIYDLRLRFHMVMSEYTADTVVIVMRIKDHERERSVGIVVDAVSDVVDAKADDIARTPDFGVSVPTETICGLITTDNKLVILLDVDKLLTAGEPAVVSDAANTTN